MSRIVTVGAAQLGPIARTESRAQAVARMIVLMRQAKSHGCDLVVFPECALTAFFPHWYFDRQADIDAYFEREMPNTATQPLFDCARELSIGFYLGFAELAVEGGSRATSIPRSSSTRPAGSSASIARFICPVMPSTSRRGRIRISRSATSSRQPGLPGVPRVRRHRRHGDLQRPPLARDLSRDGAAGGRDGAARLNTPVHNPPSPEHDNLAHFHNQLVMQAGAYQNGCWVVGVAKAGTEDGVRQIGNSMIVAPSGEIVAACSTEGDELAIARCDLDLTLSYKNTTFNFASTASHRRTG